MPLSEQATFQGYRRANGKAGTRNYLAILTSVNCSATVARLIAREFERSGMLDDYPNIDGVDRARARHRLRHGGQGRGLRQSSSARNGATPAIPTSAASLLVGLGCEVFQIGRMKDEYGLKEGELFHTMTIQATGGTRKTVEAGVAHDHGDAAGRQSRRGARRCRRAN